MDTTNSNIRFDADGVCNYCTEFKERIADTLSHDPILNKHSLDAFVKTIKAKGRGNRYDCIIGVSGGVDSSWVLVKAIELGLRPLAVHMDNGWNSELAQNNIANLVRGLGVDLHTHVINWNEYRGLMQAFFDADVIDVELLYDNAMLAVNYQQAARHGIKYMLSGTNTATEGFRIPNHWSWHKFDKRNIFKIAKQSGVAIKTFPSIGTFDMIFLGVCRRIKWIWFLDYFDFQKKAALEVLQRDFSYKPYPYKHYESIFTRFYQGYILPQKFAVDKRRVHLSALIISNQMSRDDALAFVDEIPYPSKQALEEDIQYFLKKMGWTRNQLDEYLRRPEKSHSLYGSERGFWDFSMKTYNLFRTRTTSGVKT